MFNIVAWTVLQGTDADPIICPLISIESRNIMQDSKPPKRQMAQLSPERVLWLWRWFWRVTLVLSLAYAWYCFYVPSNSITWASNYNSAKQEAFHSDKTIILFFTSKWCVPCRIMKREVWADKQVAASVNEHFIPVAIDVDNPVDAAVLARYNVVGAPVTIITDPQGNVLDWRDGGVGKADFLNLLEKAETIR